MQNKIAGASCGLVLATAAVLPARADIAAFNKDVVAGDYNAAAIEAANGRPSTKPAATSASSPANSPALPFERAGTTRQGTSPHSPPAIPGQIPTARR